MPRARLSGDETGSRHIRQEGSGVSLADTVFAEEGTMDGRQFDTLTRTFAGVSRRDALRLLASGLVAGALTGAKSGIIGAQTESEACGKKGDRCKNNGDCCNKFRCKNDKCRDKDNNNNNGNCKKDGDRCKNNGDCCNKLKCKNDKCRKKDNNNCGKKGDRCKNNGDCCNNFRCKNDKCRSKN
jgi:hypothetical protein